MAYRDIERWKTMSEADLLAELGPFHTELGAIVVNNCYELMAVSAENTRCAYDWSLVLGDVFIVLIDHYPEKVGTPRERQWREPGMCMCTIVERHGK